MTHWWFIASEGNGQKWFIGGDGLQIKGVIPLRVNEIWHADITYIRLRTSFAYLAALIDGLSRKVVGYALGRTLSAELTVQALLDALSNRNISGELTHHSDQGIQYCSQEYINILQKNNIKISMSERANPYDKDYASYCTSPLRLSFY